MKLILPKHHIPEADITYPLLFLAGPILGGGGWQEAACDYLLSKQLNSTVAVPCRWPSHHRLAQHQLTSQQVFPSQLLWERHYLDQASIKGCIVFWLPCQSQTQPRDDGQPYVRDSYGELGAWRTKLSYEPTRHVVVGAEADFPGLDVLHRNFNEDVGRDITFYKSLPDTLDAALQLIETKSQLLPN